jgi:hypothetical protein
VPLSQPFPELDEILASMGEGGRRVALIDAGEGAAGNIGVCIGWPIEVRRRFPNGESLRTHRIDVWCKHWVMARSDVPVTRAVDRIEHAEAAARYEPMDLVAGGRAEGPTREQARSVIEAFGVRPTLCRAPGALRDPCRLVH